MSAPDTIPQGLDARVTVLAPETPGLAAFLAATRSPAGAADPRRDGPFAPARVEALGALSEAFLAHPLLKRDPATVAAAYWLRPAQVRRLQAEFERRIALDSGQLRVPVGRVLHLAPSNVDTLFLYSWALAYACGNANLVRLSQERGTVVEAILGVLRDLACQRPADFERDRFVTYGHDDAITTSLSQWCSHRVIWGGDETVAALRPLALNPHASERVFGSKFSYSVFAAAPYLSAADEARARLASGFFNDLFWFDQMACSSPHVLFWVGAAREFEPAVEAFETALQAEADRRHFSAPAASAVQRRTFAFELAADADVRVSLGRPGFVGVRVLEARGLARETCGGGLLRHYRLDRLDELVAFAEERDQTVTHFGFPEGEMRTVAAQLGARGLDRLVPVGEALAFDPVWDGFDLIDDFTRRVRVR